MSALTTLAPASPARRGEPRRPLRAVERPATRRRPRVAYAIIALAGALSIGAAQMALSILTTQTSYELSQLGTEQRSLTWQKQILDDDIAGLSSPQYLAANASALGMVIIESPSYLRLSDGAILGTGSAAIGASSIDALGRGSVPNALILDTPLVTAPDATIQGVPEVPIDETLVDGQTPSTPPALTEGLPTPSTH